MFQRTATTRIRKAARKAQFLQQLLQIRSTQIHQIACLNQWVTQAQSALSCQPHFFYYFQLNAVSPLHSRIPHVYRQSMKRIQPTLCPKTVPTFKTDPPLRLHKQIQNHVILDIKNTDFAFVFFMQARRAQKKRGLKPGKHIIVCPPCRFHEQTCSGAPFLHSYPCLRTQSSKSRRSLLPL